jgi:C1A family cysteine protease
MANEEFNIEEIQSAISEAGAEWEGEKTPFTEMSEEEQTLLLGYTPGPDDPSLDEREQIATANLEAFLAGPPTAIGYPSSYDLRNVGGKNFITDIRDQGGCGSCVAFGVAATVEGSVRRQRNDPNLNVDYSEAHLFYCYARDEGRRCATGWWPSNALNAFRDKGVVDEACFRYTAGDQTCKLCSNWQSRLTKIRGWRRLRSTSQMKEWISTKGPLVACYTVYQDFYAYRGGIYRHVSGRRRGGHCVSCVGYNDVQKYWICKNSWGAGFGENGYFRIAYGECGIDSSMDTVEDIEPIWERNRRIIGLWAINQNRNAWVYVQGLGWRKISPDNDNIFFDMLTQLIAAKAGNRRVDFRQKNRVIKEIYVF